MTPEAKDKMILTIGSFGWVLAGVFIVLFFVMLRPSDYREGYDQGRQVQRGANAVKVDTFLEKPLAEDEWVTGRVQEVRENSLVLQLLNIQPNPLRGDGDIIQELIINDLPLNFVAPRTPDQQTGSRTIDLNEVQVGYEVQYLPLDPADTVGAISQAKEIFIRENEVGTQELPEGQVVELQTTE